jgi:predicted nucleic acid-binding protein
VLARSSFAIEPESAAMNAWRTRVRGAIPITLHGRLEIANGICLTAFRKAISPGALADALLSFEEHLAQGQYTEIDVLWLRRAADISRTYTPKLGCRSLDVLHVATALEVGLRDFVTFDVRPTSCASGRIEINYARTRAAAPKVSGVMLCLSRTRSDRSRARSVCGLRKVGRTFIRSTELTLST